MANKIARSSSGIGTLILTNRFVSGMGERWIILKTSGDGGPADIGSSNSPNSWNMDSSGLITVPAGATIGNDFSAYYFDDCVFTGGNYDCRQRIFKFEVVCMTESVAIGDPVWNSVMGQWDYPATISAQGGIPPYSPSRPSTITVSLSTGTSYTLSTSTSDSGSCSAGNSTVIGPAPVKPGGPPEGPGPGDGDNPSCNCHTCPNDSNGGRPQNTGNITAPDGGSIPEKYGNYGGPNAQPKERIAVRY